MSKPKRKCKKTVNYPTKYAAVRGMRNHKPSATGVVPLRVWWCKQHKAYHATTKVRF